MSNDCLGLSNFGRGVIGSSGEHDQQTSRRRRAAQGPEHSRKPRENFKSELIFTNGFYKFQKPGGQKPGFRDLELLRFSPFEKMEPLIK